MDNFGCLNSSYFYFVTYLPKKTYGVHTPTKEPLLSPHTSQYAFSWITPPASERMYFIDHPYVLVMFKF